MATFMVVLPESTHLVAKRIALGQIVITYVVGFINGVETEAIMHPIHVAASTTLGVLACVVALSLPFPRLACAEVKENCKLYAENASERLKLFVKAFCTEEKTSSNASISQAKSLATTGNKLLQSIKSMHESMQWERLPLKFVKSYYMTPENKLEHLEMPLRGMEMAFNTNTQVSTSIFHNKHHLKNGVEEHLNLTLIQVKSWLGSTIPESNADNVIKSHLQTLETIEPTHENLPSFFFIFCFKLLVPTTKPQHVKRDNISDDSFETCKKNESLFNGVRGMTILPKKERLLAAFKCSISLGLAVLLGLIYSKKDGFWAGLPVAISFASAREATFRVSNLKAQGTVLGTVYGVIGCFLFEKFLAIRFMSLLPWFILTSFLRKSKLYAQAGGISAVIGAVLVLGRNNYGAPRDFAIARIVETFIGLFCSIMVDVLMQPTRASTLAKIQLSKLLETLHECVDGISLNGGKTLNLLEEKQKKLKNDVFGLKNFIGEADMEPNFWFLPFHGACYSKLLTSFSKIMDLLLFGSLAIRFLENESNKFEETLTNDLRVVKEKLSSLINCFKEVTLIKSLALLENELVKNKNNISNDIESGKSSNSNNFGFSGSEEVELEKIISSYLQHLKQVVDHFDDEDSKSQMMLNLSAFGFCLNGLVKETREVGKGIEELLQWENPTSHINLYDISCKIHALYN